MVIWVDSETGTEPLDLESIWKILDQISVFLHCFFSGFNEIFGAEIF
jgi:hypothetical protein